MKIYIKLEPQDNEGFLKIQELVGDAIRYKTMWFLRTLENEINAEGGQIFIHIFVGKQPKVETKGFTEQLAKQILHLLTTSEEPPLF